MPCYVTGSREGDERLANEQLRKGLEELTRAVCEQCRYLERTKNTHLVTPLLADWWTKHRVVDKARVKQEALAKLTTDEKRALGLEE